MEEFSIEELRYRDTEWLWDIYDPEIDAERKQEFDGYMAGGPAEIVFADDGSVRTVYMSSLGLRTFAEGFEELAASKAGQDWSIKFEDDKTAVVSQLSTSRTWRIPFHESCYDLTEVPWQWTRVDYPAMPFVPLMGNWHDSLPIRRPEGRRLYDFDDSNQRPETGCDRKATGPEGP